ncbi:MAG TPA: amidohydrolase family protein, partial [Gemmatimonadales bacterium]
ASQVKVYTHIDSTLLAAVMEQAKTIDMPVAAHLGLVDALTAARLGVQSLEHMSGVVEATVPDRAAYFRAHQSFFAGWNMFERGWASLDSAALERTAVALAATGVAIVPTLTIHDAFVHLADSAYIASLDLSGVPATQRTAWNVPDLIRRAGLTAADFQAFAASRPHENLFVRLFHRAGGKVVAGTDSPNQLLAPGASLHHELQLLVAAGLSPKDALLAATREAAKLIRADSLGVLRAGALADFVVLGGDPLRDIANTQKVTLVVQQGAAYRPETLRAGWH